MFRIAEQFCMAREHGAAYGVSFSTPSATTLVWVPQMSLSAGSSHDPGYRPGLQYAIPPSTNYSRLMTTLQWLPPPPQYLFQHELIAT
ncbi:hypothetical protein HN51_049572 [Arachis hypogaea]